MSKEAVEALLEAEIAETIESRVRSARGDVRCLDCGLRYDERQQYGCHTAGRGHDYAEDDLIFIEEIERSTPVEYVTLSVADLRAALLMSTHVLESESNDSCVHCHEQVVLRGPGNWVHHHGLARCQSKDVPYGHLAHPASVPCRAEQPNPCLGAFS